MTRSVECWPFNWSRSFELFDWCSSLKCCARFILCKPFKRFLSKLFVYCQNRSGLIDGLWMVGVATGLIPSGTTNGVMDLRYFCGRLPWLFGAPFGFNRGRPGPRRTLFAACISDGSALSWLLFKMLVSMRVKPPRFVLREPRGLPLRRTGCFRVANSSMPYNCELEFEMLSQSTMIDSLPDSLLSVWSFTEPVGLLRPLKSTSICSTVGFSCFKRFPGSSN